MSKAIKSIVLESIETIDLVLCTKFQRGTYKCIQLIVVSKIFENMNNLWGELPEGVIRNNPSWIITHPLVYFSISFLCLHDEIHELSVGKQYLLD